MNQKFAPLAKRLLDDAMRDDDDRGVRRRVCGGCGQGASQLRRGRCEACYARWVRERPVGLGATCASCGDRRLAHLRHFELRGLWVVLCHNCCARADRLSALPHSVDGLLLCLSRERRQTERRGATAGADCWYSPAERRGQGRRASDGQAERAVDAEALVIAARPVVDPEVLSGLIEAELVELEADYARADERAPEALADEGEVTAVKF